MHSLVRCHRTIVVLLGSVALLASCGGDSSTTQPLPSRPPGQLTPSSVSVNAGDAQSAEPLQPLATEPSVVVRSANGTAVPEVTVSFSVDSGGGSIVKSTATTNAAGIASAGTWTVGNAEGPQVLVATVAGIAPARIRATARIAATVVNTAPITVTGGTITITRPGQALDGLVLKVFAGSVTAPVPITMSVVSSATLTLKGGRVAVSPALRIQGKTGLLKHQAIVRFPMTTQPDDYTFLSVHNAKTGETLVLPEQVSSAAFITAKLPSLDGSMISRPPTSANGSSAFARFLGAAAEEEDELFLVVHRIPPESQNRNYESGFEAKRDNWDFTNFAVAWLPILAGAQEGSPQTEVIDNSSGMIATMLWHFKDHRNDAPLYKQFRLVSDQARSNKVGIRWASLASAAVAPAIASILPTNGTLQEFLDDPFSEKNASLFQCHQLILLKEQFYNNYDRPQPVLLYRQPNPYAEPEDVELEPVMGIATRIVGDQLFITSMEDDGFAFPYTITRTNGLTPQKLFTDDAEQEFMVRSIMPVLERPFLDRPEVAANWPKVLDGTVGDAEGWPKTELHWAKGKLDPEKVFIGDTLTMYWECPQCPTFGLTLPDAPPGAQKPQAFQYGRMFGSSMDALPDHIVMGRMRWRPDSVASDVNPTITGHHVLLPQFEISPARFAAGWLDWQTVKYRKVSLRPDPALVEFGQDTTINVSLAPSQSLPTGTTWSWVLKTESGRDSVGTAGPTHTRELKTRDDGWLIITAYEGEHKRPIARDSIRIKAVEAAPFWKLKTFVDEDDLVDPPGEDPGQGGPLFDLLWGAESVPGSALIVISENQLTMRVKRTGMWTECCPPTFGGDDYVWTWPTWSQSTTDLTSGTITGVSTEGASEFRVQATRAGKVMTGTLTLKVSVIDPDTGKPDVSTYRMTFTAERMR